MTGLELLAARPIGASAIDAQAPGPVRAALAEPPGDSPAGASAKKQATCPGIGFLLAQFRERESLQLSLELLVPRGAAGRQPGWRERKKARRAANQVKGGRRPSSHARAKAPTGARPFGRPRGAVRRSRTGASAKMRAKVCNFRWNCLFPAEPPGDSPAGASAKKRGGPPTRSKVADGLHHTPVQRRRPAPGLSAALAEP